MHCRDHVVQLHHHRASFDALDTQVLMIGFEAQERLREWLEGTKVNFPLLQDPDRHVYQAYELKRSILRSWSPRNLWSYTRALLGGRKLYPLGSDPNQLGGDFVIDRHGILRMTYYSKDPTYRPSPSEVLKLLQRIQSDGK
jgi:peroxiredoxin